LQEERKGTDMSKKYIILVCFLILPASVYGEKAKIDLKALVKICAAYENAVKDVNVEYDFDVGITKHKNLPEDTGLYARDIGSYAGIQKHHFIGQKPFDQFFKLSRLMPDKNSKENPILCELIQACNGSEYRELQISNHGQEFAGIISDKPMPAYPGYGYTPLGCTIFYKNISNQSLSDILKGRYDYFTLCLDPNISRVNDFNTIKVACISNIWSIPSITVYFSVDHNYTIVKIADDVSADYNILQLKKLENNIWFPAKATAAGSNGHTNTLTVTKTAINQKFSKKNFDVVFPPKTAVQTK
jgi:hypothetical protein